MTVARLAGWWILAFAWGCDPATLPDVDASGLLPQLADPGPLQPGQQVTRSQVTDPPVQLTEGGLWYVQMTAPVGITASIQEADPEGNLDSFAEPVTVFLQGGTPANHRSAAAESTGDWAMTLFPDRYDVLVAPDGLLGQHAASFFPDLDMGTDGDQFDWTLPPSWPVEGRVVDAAGEPVAGMIVGLHEEGEIHRTLGLTVHSDSGGSFGFDVPEGVYDIVVAPPPDGSVPYPPVRMRRQTLPLLPGVELRVELPALPTPLVRGSVGLSTGTPVQTRLRLAGWVRPLVPGGPFTGSLYEVEFETEPDGTWALPLPRGEYRATAWPRLDDRDLGPADLVFTVRGDVDLVDGINVRFADAPPVRIAVVEPGGVLASGARLELQHLGPPCFALSATTDESGRWIGRLLPGEWRVRAKATTDSRTGRTRLARAEGTLIVDIAGGTLDLGFPESGEMAGFVYTEGQRGVSDVRVMLRDPETDSVVGEAVTQRDDSKGYFTAVVPQ